MFRTVRLLKFLGCSLVVGLLASSCVVSGGDGDDDDCAAGESRACACSNGTTGSQICLPSGNGFGTCSGCGTGSGGAANNSGGTAGNDSGGTGNDSGGTGSNTGGTYGNAGTTGEGGTPGGGGDGGMSEGGAGGGTSEPATCDECAQAECAAEWAQCAVEEAASTCAQEYICISACMEVAQMDLGDGELLTAAQITEDCVVDVCEIQSGWGGGADPATHDLLDCLAGKTGWEGPAPHWDQSSCRQACFGPLE